MKIDKKTYRTPLIDYILVSLILLLLVTVVQGVIDGATLISQFTGAGL